jgi:hypothetical protein
MRPDEWQTVIGGAISLVTVPRHSAKERIQELKAQAHYVGGEAARRLGLGDQFALAEMDVKSAVRDASQRPIFATLCQAMGIPVSSATSLVQMEANGAAMAVVLGSDNLDVPLYSALASGFLRQTTFQRWEQRLAPSAPL